MKCHKKTVWYSSFLLGIWFTLAILTFTHASGKTIKDEKPGEETLDAFGILAKTAEGYYDLADRGLKRASCLVKCSEITKTFDPALRAVIESTKFEAIIDPQGNIKVKTMDISPHFGAEAREAVGKYRKALEVQLKTIYQSINVVKILFLLEKKKGLFEAAAEPDKKLTRITLTPKKTPPEKGFKRRRGRGQRTAEKSNEAKFKKLIIWITKDYIISKIEITNQQGKSVITVRKHKYHKFWAIKQLDIIKYDREERFDERTYINISYVYPQKIMLPESIVLNLLDKKGKLIKRRNEANPVSIKFSNYQVETKE